MSALSITLSDRRFSFPQLYVEEWEDEATGFVPRVSKGQMIDSLEAVRSWLRLRDLKDNPNEWNFS